jgi:hypothetical protein
MPFYVVGFTQAGASSFAEISSSGLNPIFRWAMKHDSIDRSLALNDEVQELNNHYVNIGDPGLRQKIRDFVASLVTALPDHNERAVARTRSYITH